MARSAVSPENLAPCLARHELKFFLIVLFLLVVPPALFG